MTSAIECACSVEGKGPALIFIHGIGARRAVWTDVISRLKGDFTCISYDLRGHGESPMPNGLFGLDDLVEDLEALRSRLNVESAHFAGHSLGGMIGPAYALRFPDRVKSLGLLSTAAFRTDDDSSKVKDVVETMRKIGVAQSLDTLVARWFTDEFAAANPDIIERRKRQVLDTDESVFLNVFDIYAETEMSPWLHQVHAPSLVMTGELDGGCSPRLNIQIAHALPNSELVILDTLKHAIMLEAPDRVADAMLSFLKQR
ncbi:alpha/beta hydrolase [Mesorhizobium sp. GR13]|uniref:alpha/beta fold hydrolase n=1 Tax=Mesorhizobium sp. GR13 TaxID=2562308 RepID=UPI0010C001BA|nr:alpha/beta hydrolase [Mesorhizobium sp. GR13]